MVQTAPTPFDVGRAFVHQYYTLLHQAPQLLHRFYSTDSTFIHGGVDRPGSVEQPAVGPENISRRINELNLRDCHAKIRQVDSHPTIGNGVVVQVTGELSNNGDPMRRFMQTFVLAPRQPKKYYVQNDIFRYQDEVFDDASDDVDEDDRSSSQIYGDTDKVSNADSSAAVTQQPLLVTAPPRPPVEEQQYQPLPPRNAGEASGGNQQQQQQQQQPVVSNQPVRQQEPALNGLNESAGYNTQQEPVQVAQENQQQQQQQQQKTKQPTSTEGASYAGIAKLHSSAGPSSNVNLAGSTITSVPPPQPLNTVRPASVKTTANRTNNQQRTGGNFYQQNNRGNQWSDNTQQDPSPARRSGVAAPNDQQVFVGSLPFEFTRETLMDCFSQYGHVIDARIHPPNNENKKNFGFVIFDDPKIAAEVVKQEHITYNNIRLNVEPKTQKGFSANNSGPHGNARNANYQGRSGGNAGRGGNRGSYRGNANNPRRGGGGGGSGGQFRNNSPLLAGGDENYKGQPQQQQQ